MVAVAKRLNLLSFIQKKLIAKLIALITDASSKSSHKSPLDKVIDLCPECGDVVYPGARHKCPDNR